MTDHGKLAMIDVFCACVFVYSPATLTCDFEPDEAHSMVTDIPPHVDLACVQ